MRKVDDGEEKKKKKKKKKRKKIKAEIVATNVIASRSPNRDRLQRRPLVPILATIQVLGGGVPKWVSIWGCVSDIYLFVILL